MNRSLSELGRAFTGSELTALPGDRQLRHDAFCPFFENLHAGKLLYRDRFIALVKVVEMKLSADGFELEVRSLATIRRWDRGVMRPVPGRWRFGNTWECCTLDAGGRALKNHPNGFRLWLEADLVRQVEQLVASLNVADVGALLGDLAGPSRPRVQVA